MGSLSQLECLDREQNADKHAQALPIFLQTRKISFMGIIWVGDISAVVQRSQMGLRK